MYILLLLLRMSLVFDVAVTVVLFLFFLLLVVVGCCWLLLVVYLWSLTSSGTRTTIPSTALDMQTWHPSLEVSVSPKARSSMSSSSSVAISVILSKSSWEKMRWQVEQARVPSQAPNPSISMSFSRAMSSKFSPSFALT